MDNITPALRVSQSFRENELANLTNTLGFYNEPDSSTIAKKYKIRSLHHNLHSLNNNILDITVMLTAENLDVNILCFTEH
jgi:hypothetical protein